MIELVFHRWLLPLLSGGLLAAALPPWNSYQLAWAGLIPLFFAVNKCPLPEAFRRGDSAGLAFFGATIWWIVHVTVPGTVAVVALLALYFGLAGVLFAAVLQWVKPGQPESPGRNFLVAAIGTAGWVTLEWVRGWFLLGGFPWNFLGTTQWLAVPLIQIADFAGVYGVSALVCLVNFGLFFTLRRFATQIRSGQPIRRLSWELYLVMVLVAGSFLYGMRHLRPAEPVRSVRLALVQANIPQSLKFIPGQNEIILQRQRDLTEVVLAGRPDLIIWPETAAPSFLLTDRAFGDMVAGILAQANAPLLTGSFDKEGDRVYNAAFLFSPTGGLAGVYRKMHLVPFGEYIPLRSLWAPLLKRIGPADYDVDEFYDLARGTEPTIFEAAGCRFAALICFEDTVASLTRRFARQDVDFLVNLTNDAWFKESPAAEMHLANAVFRAIECRRPLVRATNNGVTAVIDERGVIRSQLESFTEGSLTYELGLAGEQELTFYTRWGDVFVAGCAVVTVVAGAGWVVRRRRISF